MSADDDSIDLYLREVGRYPLLTVSEENALGVRALDGDDAAVGELVSRNLRFVISVAKKYQNRGLSLGDLIGEGNVGLVTAARKFDPAQGVRFISYAVWWIRQAILSAVSRQSHIVRVPANRSVELSRISRTVDDLRQKLLREPTAREIAAAAACPVDMVRAARARGTTDISLDSPLATDGEQTLLDRYSVIDEPDPEDEATSSMLGDRLEAALDLLPPRNARILRLHFGLDGGREHTLEEIGAVLGVTRERVRQLRDRALRQLREGESARVLADFAGERAADWRTSPGRESPEKWCGASRQPAHRPPDRRLAGTIAS